MSKTALITGASSGLGAEYARQLALRGVDLVLVARDRDALAALAEELHGKRGVAVEVLAADLLNPRQRQKVERRLDDPQRPIDVLINNAGFGLPVAFERNDIEDEVRHLALHVEVPLRLTHAALRAHARAGEGRIVNVASVAAYMSGGTYGACKRWLIDFSRWANSALCATRCDGHGRLPGFTHTNFHERAGLPHGARRGSRTGCGSTRAPSWRSRSTTQPAARPSRFPRPSTRCWWRSCGSCRPGRPRDWVGVAADPDGPCREPIA